MHINKNKKKDISLNKIVVNNNFKEIIVKKSIQNHQFLN